MFLEIWYARWYENNLKLIRKKKCKIYTEYCVDKKKEDNNHIWIYIFILNYILMIIVKCIENTEYWILNFWHVYCHLNELKISDTKADSI